mgnify:CR=1 FL=1
MAGLAEVQGRLQAEAVHRGAASVKGVEPALYTAAEASARIDELDAADAIARAGLMFGLIQGASLLWAPVMGIVVVFVFVLVLSGDGVDVGQVADVRVLRHDC